MELNISNTEITQPAQTDGRPENVPEEFWNAESKSVDTEKLLAAYAEKAKAPETETAAQAEGEAEAVAEAAGVDVAAAEAHFLEHGEVSEADYEKFAKAGIDKATVDEFVTLRKAQAEAVRADMLNAVGGEEAVSKMLTWAGANWSEAQANAFNTAADSKDRAQIEMALASLKQSYDKANPPASPRPGLIQPTGQQPSGGDVFRSFDELKAAQADPRYWDRNNSAYRKSVEEKLKRSKLV